MILVLMHNNQTGQVAFNGEGGDLESMKKLLQEGIKIIDQNLAQAAAQSNGARPSGLIVPHPVVPPDITGGVG